MNVPSPVEFEGFTDGVNQEVPASSLGPKEVSMAVNFKPSGAGIRSRGGLRRLFTYTAPSGADETVLGLQTATRGGSRGLLVLGQIHASWYPSDYANPTALGTIGPSQDTEPWSIAAWNETTFAAREEDGLRIVQLSPDFLGEAGVPATTNTITAVPNATGDLTAGDYSYVEAFRDSRTGSVGNYGPVTVVTVGAGESVDLGNFTTAPSARFDERVLYRSLPDGTGAYYQIAVIDSADATYNDNISILEQGAAASQENTEPPSDVFTVIQFGARLWVTDGRLVYPSPVLNPEAFPIRSALEVGQDDNEDIVDMIAMKNRVIVGKRKSIWSISGTGATSWSIDCIDPDHGLIVRRAITLANGLVVFASDDDYYVTDGVSPSVPLSGVGRRKLKPFFQNRTGTDPLVCVPVPRSDGVIVGLGSRIVSRELLSEVPEPTEEDPVP